MEKIKEEEEAEDVPDKPLAIKIKKLQKVQNNRYLNQTIYLLFIQGRFQECLDCIDKCKPDEYKLYVKALIYKTQFKLDLSLEMLTECQVLNKMNFSYLKGIAKNLYYICDLVICLESISPVWKQPRMPTSSTARITRYFT